MTFEGQMDERYRRWLVKLNWTGSRREFEAWKAAAEAERERCAVKCDEIEAHWREQARTHNLDVDHGRRDGAMWCGDAIRKLGEVD